MKISLTAILATLLTLNVFGSNEVLNISGKVYDNTSKEPLVNAHISENNILIAITNNAGEFQFKSAKEELKISVSYVGYKPFEMTFSPSDLGFVEIPMIELNLGEARVTAESSSFIKLEPRAVENFTVFAGKKADLVQVDKLLLNSASNNPRQAFSRISGLSIWETDAGGMQLSIGSRGLDPNRTSHYNVRQNGADISAEPLGYPEAYYTPNLNSVERIEIIRGAASLQYGPQFGGLINFKMKEGITSKKLRTTAQLSAGSFGLFQGYLSLDGQSNSVNYFFSANHKLGNGWTDNAVFDQSSFYGSVRFNYSEKSSLKVSASYMDYESQQAGGLTDAQFEENPFQSNRNRNWFDVNWLTAHAEWSRKLSDNTTLESKFFMVNASRTATGFLEAPNRIDTGEERDIIHGEYHNWGNETRLKALHSVSEHHATLVAGARIFLGNTVSQQMKGNADSTPISFEEIRTSNPISDYTFSNVNAAAFIEEVLFINKWKITPGLRYEYISTGHEGTYTEIQTDGAGNILPGYPISEFSEGESTRSIVLFGIGIERSLTSSSSVLFNLTKNYRPVNFSDLFISRPRISVDPSITDERGLSADLEFKFKVKSWLRGSVDFYSLIYKDKIGTILTTFEDPLLGSRLLRLRTNVNDGLSYGADANVEIDLLDLLNSKNESWLVLPFGSISYNQSKYSGNSSVYASVTDGNQIEKAPILQYKAGVRIERSKAAFEALYSYVGEQFSDASNSTYDATGIAGLIPSYSLLDLSAKYNVKNFTVSLNVNNALNRAYFARRAAGYPGPGIITASPRSYGVSLGYQF